MVEAGPEVTNNPLFFLDYDGTLAPIVQDPMQAYPHEEAPSILRRLNERYPLWIVTGRNLMDLEVLLGMPLHGIGLHGAQQGTIGGDVRSLIPETSQASLDRMRQSVPDLEGLRVEEKGYTFAVHFRGIQDETLARAKLETWVTDLPEDLEAIWGKMVVELRPRGINKGFAVRRIVEAHSDRTPVYAGDDVTDEDAFRELGTQAITIKVGTGPTAAKYRIHSVDEVVNYLKRYL